MKRPKRRPPARTDEKEAMYGYVFFSSVYKIFHATAKPNWFNNFVTGHLLLSQVNRCILANIQNSFLSF